MIKTTVGEFLSVLQVVQQASTTRSMFPELAGVKIEAQALGTVSVTCSNLEITATFEMTAGVTDSVNVVVPVKPLVDLLRTYPAQKELSLEQVEPRVVRADEDQEPLPGRQINYDLKVRCGRRHATLKGLSVDSFPQPVLPEGGVKLELPPGVFKQAIKRVHTSAAGQDEGRPILQGILITTSPGQVVFVACDGIHLSRVTSQVPLCTETITKVVPGHPLSLIGSSITGFTDSNVTIVLGEQNVWITYGDLTVVSQLLDGAYPDYSAVIPTGDPATIVEAMPTDLLKGIYAVKPFDRDRWMNFEMTPTVGIVVSKEDAECGSARSTVPAVVTGDPLVIKLTPGRLIQALKCLGGRVARMYFNGNANPLKLESEDYVYVLMPQVSIGQAQ